MTDDTDPDLKAALPTHHLASMNGRDPHEDNRVATPLELLFDLTFVIAFGLAAAQLAHLLAEGHVRAGLIGFSFAMFAVCWAWTNFSWFASAFDTDDWIYRVTTMVQMVGVIILALGLPRMFSSVDEGGHIDNGIMVLGYVVMRGAMLFQWLRAARQYPEGRAACIASAIAILVAQCGWVVLIFIDMRLVPTLLSAAVLVIVELMGPVIAERRMGGTPWHAHHIAERYGLLAIIALGEGVVGTVASMSAIIDEQGWSLDTILICVAGTGLTFSMWWLYFLLPSGEILHRFRERAFLWAYGHMILFSAIAATGAGLHVAAYYIEHQAHISAAATVSMVAVPVFVYVLMVFLRFAYLLQRVRAFNVWLMVGTTALSVFPVVLATLGVDVTTCIVILTLAPIVPIVGYEIKGHRYGRAELEQLLA